MSKALHEHPASVAWRRLGVGSNPQAIQVLSYKKGQSQVCRLEAAGPTGSTIIAKCCPRRTATLERVIYEQVLVSFPISRLTFYGAVEEDNSFFDWLFLEDAGDEAPLLSSEFHRLLVSRWLACLHVYGAYTSSGAWLPERGPDVYFRHLGMARGDIAAGLGEVALSAEDKAMLKSVLATCGLVEARWSEVIELCRGLPPTLVHGDFVPKNIRVRGGPDSVDVLPLDWEMAGWGVPAADLAECPDLDAYVSVARTSWPLLDATEINRTAHAGNLFRLLAAMHWSSCRLPLGKALAQLRFYGQQLDAWVSATGWHR